MVTRKMNSRLYFQALEIQARKLVAHGLEESGAGPFLSRSMRLIAFGTQHYVNCEHCQSTRKVQSLSTTESQSVQVRSGSSED